MPNITLPFDFDINVSAQVGDTVYYVSTVSQNEFTINSSDVIEIGRIIGIDHRTTPDELSRIEVETTRGLYPKKGDFILFSKDNKVNMTSLLGYYAKVKMRNNSKKEAEIFRVNADYFESSK